MEVAAGYVGQPDVQAGRVIDEIDRLGLGENPVTFYISGDETSSDVMAGKRLIDQALDTVLAAESLGPRDQISLTPEQALVWAVYLRVIERHRGFASGEEIKHSVHAARKGGISVEEIEAAIAAAGRPEAREEK